MLQLQSTETSVKRLPKDEADKIASRVNKKPENSASKSIQPDTIRHS